MAWTVATHLFTSNHYVYVKRGLSDSVFFLRFTHPSCASQLWFFVWNRVSGLSRSEEWQFLRDVSEEPIVPSSRIQESLNS